MVTRCAPALAAFACLANLSGASAQQTEGWRTITPAPDLRGWRVLGGSAPFTVENGELVGRSVTGSPNSFLASAPIYGDFILEYEAKTDSRLNSGVMIRGQSRADYRNGAVHGYQVELDPGLRAWSGGVYDEQRRRWLYTLARNDAARRAFRPGEWNKFRVEAVGSTIRTFVNGVPAAHLVDDVDARGFIAFQVHSVPDEPGMRGLEARFRNIRVITAEPARHRLRRPVAEEQSYLVNRLTPAERRAGWRLLWDGRTSAGWRGAKLAGFPQRGWTMRDGLLTVESSGGSEARNGGDIITTQDYSNFELSVDFRITPGANSGIKYFVDPDLLKGEGSAIGLEYQILDDERHLDAKMGRNGNRTVSSLYDLITARNLSDPTNPNKPVNPPGQWNRARLLVRGTQVEHWLNGVKVVEYERGSPQFRALVAQSKYKSWPRFGEWPKGPILLQDHGDEVSFRSIKLRPL